MQKSALRKVFNFSVSGPTLLLTWSYLTQLIAAAACIRINNYDEFVYPQNQGAT